MPSCHVRRATVDDVDAMADLLAELFAIETEFAIHREKQKQGLVMVLDREHAVIHCAEIAGRVVGMCSAQCLVSTAVGGLSALIEDLVIRAAYRRKGIGTLLLASIEAWARGQGATRVQLLADSRNKGAETFYARSGWGTTRMTCWRKYEPGD